MAERKLRAVPAAKKAPAKRAPAKKTTARATPPAPRAKNVAEAAKAGTKLELLVAMRDRIATTVTSPDCPPRELGVLTKRLSEIVKEIESEKAQAAEQAEVAEMDDDGDISDAYDPSAV